jgi:tripartite-type tricarboxylate transporter receptor subunit TctC
MELSPKLLNIESVEFFYSCYFFFGDIMINRRTNIVQSALATLFLAASAGSALAQAAPAAAPWPTQSVKIVVPYAAGGTTDIAARILANELSKKWGQPVMVDNKPGASTQIGTDLVAKSKDGHTLLMTASPYAVNPSLFAKLPYDTYKDFKPVTLVVRNGLFLVTSGTQPYANVKDLFEAGKGDKTVSIASPANGSMAHMVAELVADIQKLNLLHVPYRGTPPALTDVIGGQVQFMFDNPSSSLPLIKDGKLKALAYTGSKRSKALPNVPTVGETIPGFEAINWFGMLAPSAMDDKLLDRIAKDANDILKRKEVVERFSNEGVEIGGIPREAFGAFLAVETVRWAKIVKARNIKPD